MNSRILPYCIAIMIPVSAFISICLATYTPIPLLNSGESPIIWQDKLNDNFTEIALEFGLVTSEVTTNELITSTILNGTDLEIVEAGITFVTDLSSLSGGGGGTNFMRAEMHISESTNVTTISAADTPVQVTSGWASNDLNEDWAFSTNQIQYTGTATRVCYVGNAATILGDDGNSKEIVIVVRRNGIDLGTGRSAATDVTTQVPGNMAGFAFASITNNDVFTVFVENRQNSKNVIVRDADLVIFSVD